MSFLWFALLPAAPSRPALAQAPAFHDDGTPAGVLAAWSPGRRPDGVDAKISARAIDPAGAPARVSLVLAPAGVRLPFDDAAVLGARRAVMAGPPRRCVSTLLDGASVFAGALTAAHDDDPRPVDDPFARVFPAVALRVGAGLVGMHPPPAGPVVERYAGLPWPWDRWSRG